MPEKEKPEHRIELGAVTPHNYRQLKILNSVVFPVTYNDKFYQKVLEPTNSNLARLAYCNDIVVGAVCCRIDKEETGQKKLYIMTLGCLAPYRRLGIGTKLLEHVEKLATDDEYNSIYLHVQVENDSALEFYKKNGFKVVDIKENYYKRIEPADAHVLQKTLKEVESEATNGNTH